MSWLTFLQRGEWVHHPKLTKASPYLRLMRLDKPVGIWLLMWPSWWAIILCSPVPQYDLLALFFVGAILMRGAACVVNDIWDRNLDKQVARTKERPLASGELQVKDALRLLFLLLCGAFIIWLYLPLTARMIALCSLIPVGVYPLMKRYTHIPQLFLGFTINLSALIGGFAASAIEGGNAGPAVLLYLGCVCWTFGYDTIYGHQDKEDDAIVGIKSSALLFGDNSRNIVSGLYHLAGGLWLLAGLVAGASLWFYLFFGPVAYNLFRQIEDTRYNNPDSCLKQFKANIDLGFYMFLAVVAAVYL